MALRLPYSKPPYRGVCFALIGLTTGVSCFCILQGLHIIYLSDFLNGGGVRGRGEFQGLNLVGFTQKTIVQSIIFLFCDKKSNLKNKTPPLPPFIIYAVKNEINKSVMAL